MMMSATAGEAEHGLAPTTSQQLEWVSKLGEIQKTIDQLGELKRGDGWVQLEAAEAQRIRTDRAEATLQILGELNLNMRSEIEKQGARVDLGRQIQFMRRLLDAEQQKEQAAHVMRQDIPEDSGTKQEHGQKDLNCGEEIVKVRQTSRRHKLLMHRLCEDERQREGAKRKLRNFISQVLDYKQETAKTDSSGHHSGSDRDSNSVRRAVMPDSGEATSHEYAPADKREDQDWADATVAVKCSKCGKACMTEPVEGKAMAAVATRDAGKTPLTVENVQEAVVKALATQAPAAATFAGRHELERGNRFGLGEHTAFRAIAEGGDGRRGVSGGRGRWRG